VAGTCYSHFEPWRLNTTAIPPSRAQRQSNESAWSPRRELGAEKYRPMKMNNAFPGTAIGYWEFSGPRIENRIDCLSSPQATSHSVFETPRGGDKSWSVQARWR
jgi:hypothetical protein